MGHAKKPKHPNDREDIRHLREDAQLDRLAQSLGLIANSVHIFGYQCLICGKRSMVPRFKRRPNHRAYRGGMMRHIKAHFITSI